MQSSVAKTAALNHLEFRACLVFFRVQRYNLWLEKHAAWAAERRHAMTKIDIFSGFLGAGKTTLIKKLIREAYAGEKLVLIENEFGEIAVDGVFIAVGIVPVSALIAGTVETDEAGYIKAGEDGVTSVPGVFAAGDVRTKQLRQIITAAADGANCVTSVEKYLISH